MKMLSRGWTPQLPPCDEYVIHINSLDECLGIEFTIVYVMNYVISLEYN